MPKESSWTVEVDDHDTPPADVFHCEGPAAIAAWLERWVQQEAEDPTGCSLIIHPPAIFLPANEGLCEWVPDEEIEPATLPLHDWTAGLYRVLSASGKVLGNFDDRDMALAAMRHWPQATSVVCGNNVVGEKSDRNRRAA